MSDIESTLLHELIRRTAAARPSAPALTLGADTWSYEQLDRDVSAFASGLRALGAGRAARVGVYLEKRIETVVASFGAAAAGCVFVPANPLLKPAQVAFILRDCDVSVLVTSRDRLATLAQELHACSHLAHVVIVDGAGSDVGPAVRAEVHEWSQLLQAAPRVGHRVIDTDLVSILYTSGSTGRPKGVVLSHRNMVVGAKSVASYLENRSDDTLLAALPLSFDAGFSQLTTAFHTGARVVLLNYLMPRDVLKAMERERVTGLTAVPPLYIQLTSLEWPSVIADNLRYFANTGGRMPRETLTLLRQRVPRARPYLMYGLTEAFRSTYLPPDQANARPDSMGKAIPNAEIMVLREDGSVCAPNEPGELVHRGVHVSLGYWNDPAKTAERFKVIQARQSGLVMPEVAVWSGDTVRMDEDGYLYFISRRDEMIKTSGYRVSPTEVEEVVYGTDQVGECAAFGIAHPQLGQAIVVVASAKPGASVDPAAVIAHCRKHLPSFMVPHHVDVRSGSLPRNPNGKIDRKQLAGELAHIFEQAE